MDSEGEVLVVVPGESHVEEGEGVCIVSRDFWKGGDASNLSDGSQISAVNWRNSLPARLLISDWNAFSHWWMSDGVMLPLNMPSPSSL